MSGRQNEAETGISGATEIGTVKETEIVTGTETGTQFNRKMLASVLA